MFKVVYTMAPNVKVIDSEFESEYEACEALFDYLQMEYQFDQSGEYDIELESTYYAVVEC